MNGRPPRTEKKHTPKISGQYPANLRSYCQLEELLYAVASPLLSEDLCRRRRGEKGSAVLVWPGGCQGGGAMTVADCGVPAVRKG